MKKPASLSTRLLPLLAVLLVLGIWWLVTATGQVPTFMLPGPVAVFEALIADWGLLMSNLVVTLQEALWGLLLGLLLGIVLAIIMDQVSWLYQMVYPLLVISQTVPTIALAPLLILWFGYGMMPKIILICLTTFFPVAIETLAGLRQTPDELLALLATMQAKWWQTLWFVKLPSAIDHIFAGLRVAVAYAVISAVVSEWVGGIAGLGVYMTRVKKAYAFDRMFAVIIIITALSLGLMGLVSWLQRIVEPWRRKHAN